MSHPLFTLPANAYGWAPAPQTIDTKSGLPPLPVPTTPLSPAPTYEQTVNPIGSSQQQTVLAQLTPAQQTAVAALLLQQQHLSASAAGAEQQRASLNHHHHQQQQQIIQQQQALQQQALQQQALQQQAAAATATRCAQPLPALDDGLYTVEAIVASYSRCMTCDISSDMPSPCPKALSDAGLHPATWARVITQTRQMKSKSDTNKVLLHVFGGLAFGLLFNVMVAKHWVGNKPLRRQLATFHERENATLGAAGTPVRFVWSGGTLKAYFNPQPLFVQALLLAAARKLVRCGGTRKAVILAESQDRVALSASQRPQPLAFARDSGLHCFVKSACGHGSYRKGFENSFEKLAHDRTLLAYAVLIEPNLGRRRAHNPRCIPRDICLCLPVNMRLSDWAPVRSQRAE
ncbi:hypothetical protein BDZ90DRAFT_228669 [Jaminaea rosea]|uniref:Uncharacterized protein n=1 Tax=Jaminaea rosea TaxID=1569628 RepID=A0A316UIJ8_9BASI|nr:hypothetical protein BDZ90DRAFT_228669 [Jaminaea rosea]PWN25040.1 hypothetical protein BDZ90DRAFT_228669 [Jaminaea rosea]